MPIVAPADILDMVVGDQVARNYAAAAVVGRTIQASVLKDAAKDLDPGPRW